MEVPQLDEVFNLIFELPTLVGGVAHVFVIGAPFVGVSRIPPPLKHGARLPVVDRSLCRQIDIFPGVHQVGVLRILGIVAPLPFFGQLRPVLAFARSLPPGGIHACLSYFRL